MILSKLKGLGQAQRMLDRQSRMTEFVQQRNTERNDIIDSQHHSQSQFIAVFPLQCTVKTGEQ